MAGGGRLLTAALWALAAVIAGSVVWGAVAVLDAPRTDVLTQSQVSAAAARQGNRPSSAGASAPVPADPTLPTTTPSAVSPPVATQPAAPPPPTAPAAVVRTWNVTGGSVSASCVGSMISLVYATPANGWRLKVSDRGPEKIEVKFSGSASSTSLKATCVAGVPQERVEVEAEGSD